MIKNYNQKIREANERYAPYLSLKEQGIEVEAEINEEDIIDERSLEVYDAYNDNERSLFDFSSDK